MEATYPSLWHKRVRVSNIKINQSEQSLDSPRSMRVDQPDPFSLDFSRGELNEPFSVPDV